MSRSLLLACALTLVLACAAPAHAAQTFPFQPIEIERIDLPAKIKEASRPLFTNDGEHLLFWSRDELWITDRDGAGTRCLSCGVPGSPRSKGEDLATPFPDGKRVFFGGFVQPGDSQMAVLECAPSVVDCRRRKILPVDFSAAQPQTIEAGGIARVPQANLRGSSSAKLSQDGRYVGFSDVRSDSLLNMVVARLLRADGKYALADPRVLNPPGPTSATDPDVTAWSDSSALYELKSFTNGGADVTYAQAGGARGGTDVWSVNLATGKRTRLTAHPDWDEDNAISRDGGLLALWSGRTMHYSDWISGLVSAREFARAPLSVMAAGAIGANKMCHGPMWLLPAGGDQGGTLAGQPVLSSAYDDVSVTNNLTGWAQWSPDGTRLALNTNLTREPYDRPAGRNAPFLLVAHLSARRPTRPRRAVSSKVGTWAPRPEDYHGALAHQGSVTLNGLRAGTVTLTFAGEPGPGIFYGGSWTATYAGYSDDGASFVTGTTRTAGGVDATGGLEGTYSAHLQMTGRHTGSHDAELSFARLRLGGTSRSVLDGATLTGPQREQIAGAACPKMLPDKPALRATATRLRGGRHRVRVTASVGSMGAAEADVDTRPVRAARVRVGDRTVGTDARGVATIRGRGTVRIAAGDTLAPTTITVR